MLKTILPKHEIPSNYYDCRYAVLRQPLGFQRGAELLDDDDEALHSYIEVNNQVLAVGRAHLISHDSDGSAADHAGPDATKCPGFGPLKEQQYRPAIQIRQMGTLDSHRRKGHAAEVLSQLEKSSIDLLGASVGFLQARQIAIPFYQSQGWQIIDDPYEIKGIGPHRSMMKHFR